MVHAQQPTCTNLRIRSTQDTHKIFYAIQKGLLHMVTRRLDADERLALRSGCVYAWEERGPHSEITGLGIERFTEGRRWTPSRVRDEFLFYYERYMPPLDANQPGSQQECKPPRDWEPLVKQTYSVWVETDCGRRKWHLTAYFTQGTIDQLGTVDAIPGVRDLVVPEGHFKSTRVGKSRAKQDEPRSDATSKPTSTVTRTYAPFPSPYPVNSPADGSSSFQPVLMHEPYQNNTHSGYYHQSQQPAEERSESQSQSPQDRSPVSSSPTIASRTQYASDRPVEHQAQGPLPSLYGEQKPELRPRYADPAPSGPQQHIRHPEYRVLAPSSCIAPEHNGRQPVIGPYNYTNGLKPSETFPAQHWADTSSNVPYPHQPPGPAQIHSATAISQAGYNIPPNHSPSQPISYSPITLASQLSSYRLSSPVETITLSPTAVVRRTSLPPLLHIPMEEAAFPYELSPTNGLETLNLDTRNGSSRPSRALVPLHALNRQHPYRRDQQDDKTLRRLQNPPSASPSL